MKRILYLLLFIFFLASASFAQLDTQFWFAPPYADPAHDSNNQFRFVFSTGAIASTVTISQPANPSFTPISFTINANSNQIQIINETFANVYQANDISGRGFSITATEPVFCYYEVYTPPSVSVLNTELFSLKGENALGTDFFIPMQNLSDNYTEYSYTCYNYFSVLATEDNTSVTITPTQNIVGHPAGTPFTVNLDAGEFYTGRGQDISAAGHPAGTRVVSDKNVAITYYDDSMSGSLWGGCADMGGDQIVPIAMLGTTYIPVQGYVYNPYSSTFPGPFEPVFVLATADNTEVAINGAVVATINTGETYIYQFANNPNTNAEAAFITTSDPAYVSQVSGFGCELGYSILPTVDCRGSNDVSITRSQGNSFFLTIVTTQEHIGNFTFNGNAGVIVASDFQEVPNTGGVYRFARKSLSVSQFPVGSVARIQNSSGMFQLGVINGGTSNTCKFGFFSDFSEYLIKGGIQDIDNNYCGIQPPPTLDIVAQVNIEPAFYEWNTGSTNDTITIVPTPGSTTYAVTISDPCGNEIYDSITVRVSGMSLTGIEETDVSCYNECDGELLINVENDFQPFTYTYGNAAFFYIQDSLTTTSDPHITGLCPKNYYIKITDDIGCTIETNATISNKPNILLSDGILSTQAEYCGTPDEITLTASAVVPDANFTWFNNTHNASVTFTPNLGENEYSVSITDICGNEFVDDITIFVSEISATGHSDPDVNGACTGEVWAIPGDGIPPYTFYWYAPLAAFGQYQEDICEGEYTVQITDAIGCQTEVSVEVPFVVNINTDKENHVSIYPNPAKSYATIDLSSIRADAAEIRIFDITGKRLGTFLTTESYFKTPELAAGTYFIEIYIHGKHILKDKLIITE